MVNARRRRGAVVFEVNKCLGIGVCRDMQARYAFHIRTHLTHGGEIPSVLIRRVSRACSSGVLRYPVPWSPTLPSDDHGN
jgi:hypothetical protein